VEIAQVGDDVFFRTSGSGSADDDPSGETVLLAEFAHNAPEAAPFVARIDLARNADVIDGRHEHQKPPGHRGVAREAGALRAERLLGHLHDDLLPFLDQLFDFRLGALIPVAVTTAAISRGWTTERGGTFAGTFSLSVVV
jgi:hypothetical protein